MFLVKAEGSHAPQSAHAPLPYEITRSGISPRSGFVQLGGQADANTGYGFAIFMASVGSLRLGGLRRPLTLGVTRHEYTRKLLSSDKGAPLQASWIPLLVPWLRRSHDWSKCGVRRRSEQLWNGLPYLGSKCRRQCAPCLDHDDEMAT